MLELRGIRRVLKLIALLENVSIEEVKTRLFQNTSQNRLHPAERLNLRQLKEIGFEPINWIKLRQSNPVLYRNTLSWVWREWQRQVSLLKRYGYICFLAAETPQEKQAICREYAQQLRLDAQELMLEYVRFVLKTTARVCKRGGTIAGSPKKEKRGVKAHAEHYYTHREARQGP